MSDHDTYPGPQRPLQTLNGRIVVPIDPAFALRREMLEGIRQVGPIAIRVSIAAEVERLRASARIE